MEERLADLERRMSDWEVTRVRAQRRANFWFSLLTLIMFASPFLVTPPEDEATPGHAQAAAMPRIRFGRLEYALRPRWRRHGAARKPLPGAARAADPTAAPAATHTGS